jgi:predicted RNA binding protein YcfA (HicA-like mRNA interferase family)
MSQRFPALKPKDVLRLLQREGFIVHHASGCASRFPGMAGT